ncbi:MAG TPA: GGDEF domain-containing protein, partial [Polyangiaceae bacterium]
MKLEETTAVRAPTKLPERLGASACFIVLSGQAIGRIYKLTEAKYTIGRSEQAEICIDDEGISRLHAGVVCYDKSVILKDLDSTNGTFVNGEPIRVRTLGNGDRVQLGATTILKFAVQDEVDEQFQEHLYAAANRDSLTHTYNRRHFNDQLSRDLSYARRHDSPLTLAIIDLDYFKHINDEFGHPAGDAVLQQFSKTVLGCIRNEDFLCRIGGEEFALVMRGTRLDGAMNVCERLRKSVEQTAFTYQEHSIAVTVSIGIAEYIGSRHPHMDDLVKDADQRLYDAKFAGRNRVRGFSTPTPT